MVGSGSDCAAEPTQRHWRVLQSRPDSVVYNPSPDNRYRLSLSHSDDAGVSWSRAATLDNSDVEVSYPSFIVGMKSRVHGVYTYNRRMIKYVSFPPHGGWTDIEVFNCSPASTLECFPKVSFEWAIEQ